MSALPQKIETNLTDSMSSEEKLKLTRDIVVAKITQGDTEDVEALMRKVYSTLSSMDKVAPPEFIKPKDAKKLIKDTVTDDYLICLEDGKKLKMLKRHLNAHFDMTVEQYLTKWGLPHDYPTTAKNYSIRRSTLAKGIGLGKVYRKGKNNVQG